MKITRIENQKKRPGRKNIFADGEFLIGVGAETLLRFGLRTGDEVSPDLLGRIQQMEEQLGAKTAALHFMSVRPRTEREVRDKLREKEFGDGEIARVIADLKSTSLLNDAEFARLFIRNAITLKPTGSALLKRKLFLLGVDKGTVEEALTEVLGGVDQRGEAARAAATFLKKAAGGRRKADPEKLRRTLTAFLLRRGFAWDVVRPVVMQSIAGEGVGDDGETPEGRL
jgi:regulatory protein